LLALITAEGENRPKQVKKRMLAHVVLPGRGDLGPVDEKKQSHTVKMSGGGRVHGVSRTRGGGEGDQRPGRKTPDTEAIGNRRRL